MSSEPAINRRPGERLDLRIPGHVGVIMDGNGRWAQARGRPRTDGHAEGVKALRRLVELCLIYGIRHLTVFSFSSENWSRPRDEISFIFSLLRRFVASDLERLIENNVQVRIIGDRVGLEDSLQRLIAEVEARTASNTGLVLMVAFNYGGKAEIVEATRRIARQVAAGERHPDDITEMTMAEALYTSGIPDPDVILRTGGEQRVSNFLLWQAAYTELVFVEDNWPDFDESTFLRMLEDYSMRERRFGGVGGRSR